MSRLIITKINKDGTEGKQYSIPAPGGIPAQGIGTIIKRMTTAVGIKPCGGCQKRAEWLDKRVRIVR